MSTEIAAENQNTALANWEDRLAQFATEAVQAEAAPSGSFITTRGGILKFQGDSVAGNKLDVVVLDSLFENTYYDEDFDPDSPASPACFAFGHSEADLKPHPDAGKPQHETCKGCPMNEFGSADRGKGKACKNSRRLSMISASPLDATTAQTNEVAFLKLPVTSVKNWSTYVHTLSTVSKRPPFAVVTQIGVQPDPKSQYKITFNAVSAVNDGGVIDALIKRHESAKASEPTPYQKNAEKPEGGAAKKARKF
jgi:hypothetical protein